MYYFYYESDTRRDIPGKIEVYGSNSSLNFPGSNPGTLINKFEIGPNGISAPTGDNQFTVLEFNHIEKYSCALIDLSQIYMSKCGLFPTWRS